MKLVVVSRYPPASEGISDYGRHIASSLAARDDVERVNVVANVTDRRCEKHETGPVVHRVWRENDALTPLKVMAAITKTGPDAIWYNVGLTMFGTTPSSLLGFLLPGLTRRRGIRSVVTLHELPMGRLPSLGFRGGAMRELGLRVALALLRQADLICVTLDDFRRRLGSAEIVHLPLCGYDEPTIGSFSGPPTALILTSHAPHKKLETLLEAFRIVRRRLPQARLLVAGIDHPRFPGYLAGVRRRYPDEQGVEWLGPLVDAEVAPILRQSWVVVAPYGHATGSSATIHQAVGLGRPVVASDLPAFRSMAATEDLWLEFFPVGDVASLGTKLGDLLDDPHSQRVIALHNHHSAMRNSLRATTESYARLLRGSNASKPEDFAVSGYYGRRGESSPRPAQEYNYQ